MRHFEQMLKESGLEKVKMMKIDEDLAPLTPHYEVKKPEYFEHMIVHDIRTL